MQIRNLFSLTILSFLFPVFLTASDPNFFPSTEQSPEQGTKSFSGWVYMVESGWYFSPIIGRWLTIPDPDLQTTRMIQVEGGVLSGGELDGSSLPTFYIGETEVTIGEWFYVRNWAIANGYHWSSSPAGCGDLYPATLISWYGATKWCNAKSEMEGLTPVYQYDGDVYRAGQYGRYNSDLITMDPEANGYRLPLEAEWEFAARGGTLSMGYLYAGSDDIDTVAWYQENSEGSSCIIEFPRGLWPVAMKAPNELGLFDMTGNAEEWCWELDETYGQYRHVRGGHFTAEADKCLVSYRSAPSPDVHYGTLGFRLARSVPD